MPFSTTLTDPPKRSRTYSDRWKHPELFESGYLVVPSTFLRHYSRLKPHGLTHGEVLFVLHLMEFKWDRTAPFPSYGTLARRMGVSTKMARRYAQALEQKGFLYRLIRTGNTNRFDLTPLFDKLRKQARSAARVRTRTFKLYEAACLLANWPPEWPIRDVAAREEYESLLKSIKKEELGGELAFEAGWRSGAESSEVHELEIDSEVLRRYIHSMKREIPPFLDEKFDATVAPMRTFNLFISHSWGYSDSYTKLVALLRKRSYFEFKNYSVPRDDPIHNAGTDTQLREAIRRQMAPCSVVLILAGVYASYSKWIDEEIKLATSGFSYPKPIVAVEPWGSQKTSLRVKLAADRVVGWNTESVVSAIRELA